MQDLTKELEEYKNILLNTTEGQIGRDYLKYRRITKATAVEWEMGYCPVGYIPIIYREIAKDPKIYKFWEKMWGRLLFPIYDQNGVLVSISGRKVVDVPSRDKNPKYDHYPFASRKVLFGLWKNKEEIFKMNKAIITEGQLDVITAWQAGIKIITSSFGAHCSENHFIILNRYAEDIIVMYDNDDAGKKGTDKAREIAIQNKFRIKFKCPFPQGVDMDAWLQKHTSEEFFKLINYDKMSYLQDKLKKMGAK
jgi:DNA primase